MKLHFVLFLTLSANVFAFTPSNNALSFIANKGQISDQNYKPRKDVLFSGNDGALMFFLKNNGLSYQFNRVDKWRSNPKGIGEEKDNRHKIPQQTTVYRLDINWINSNTSAEVTAAKPLSSYTNYYLEACPDGLLKVPNYEEVYYKNIYAGINLKYYAVNGHLKYDYQVSAGASYKQIKFEYKGTQSIAVNKNGELEITTPLGTITEQKPLVLQNGKNLEAQWLVEGNVVSFEISGINPQEAFIIDPAVRTWGTYYYQSFINSGTVDSQGNFISSGTTYASTNIATVGAYQTILGGVQDAILLKFDKNGNRLWATYYGGSTGENFENVDCDINNNIFVQGLVNGNSSVIATAGAHQTIYGGGIQDLIICKFNSSGARIWGTYYGGENDENYGAGCNVDNNGDVYFAGTTKSNTGIATSGSHQSINMGDDAFLVKLNSNGMRLWGTYYGDTNYEIAYGLSIDNNSCYLSGSTSSSSGIATPGSFQPSNIYNDQDAFLVKFSANGVRQWGTFFGGSQMETYSQCTTDGFGNVYLVGNTTSSSGIASPGAFQPSISHTINSYLAKFSSTGSRIWSTYFGCDSTIYTYSCGADKFGNVYFSGRTWCSTGLPTSGSHQPIYGGLTDCFLGLFDKNGNHQWTSYYGGSNLEYDGKLAIDTSGYIYLFGVTGSTASIATPGSFMPVSAGGDGFIVQFSETPLAGINENFSSENYALVYPNPTSGKVEIKCKNCSLKNTVNYKLYDALGRLLNEDELVNSIIDVSAYKEGIYFVKLFSDSREILSTKIIKQ